ncbi:Uncharacterised protein [Rodentibacter pneumotropicus]|uniref:Uncharacterized protein n=1 Tax=Rodentibacter pneumotropicus TaxID=758 RepID=A0A3S4U453_9PAST|nr:Uncharacterised protein [Rodentibacter pneumotropicus]
MSSSAIIMMIIALGVIWGGFFLPLSDYQKKIIKLSTALCQSAVVFYLLLSLLLNKFL